MMAKKPDDRPASMWEFLKDVRGISLFNKRPRKPKESVFDNSSSIKGADDMIKKPKAGFDEEDE